MATRATESVPTTGLAATYNAASGGGDRVSPGAIVHVKNGNAAILTVTISTPLTLDGDLTVADRTFTVPATTGEKFVKIQNDTTYRDPTDGLVGLSWSVTSTVTFAVIA